MANRVGPLETDLPGKLPYLKSSFPGLSSIVESDGVVKESLGDEEGVIVSDIIIGERKQKKERPKKYGKNWGIPVPWYAFIWPVTQKMGEKSYATNPRRKERALSISTGVESASP